MLSFLVMINTKDQLFSIPETIGLQLLQFGIMILLAVPLFVATSIGLKLEHAFNLTSANFYMFVIASQIIGAFVALYLIHSRIRQRRLSWSAVGFSRFSPKKAILYFFGYYGLMILFLVLIAIISSILIPNSSDSATTSTEPLASTLGLWPSIVSLVIIAPIVEEVIFRGILLKSFMSRYGVKTSIGASGIVFAILHLDPIHAISIAPLGIYLGYVYHKTGSIIPGIIIHASWNMLVISLTTNLLTR